MKDYWITECIMSSKDNWITWELVYLEVIVMCIFIEQLWYELSERETDERYLTRRLQSSPQIFRMRISIA